MTDRLKEIEKRCKGATEGPWWNESGIIHCKSETWTEQIHSYDHPVKAEKEEDAEFCAEARADVPYLLERLKEAVYKSVEAK